MPRGRWKSSLLGPLLIAAASQCAFRCSKVAEANLPRIATESDGNWIKKGKARKRGEFTG